MLSCQLDANYEVDVVPASQKLYGIKHYAGAFSSHPAFICLNTLQPYQLIAGCREHHLVYKLYTISMQDFCITAASACKHCSHRKYAACKHCMLLSAEVWQSCMEPWDGHLFLFSFFFFSFLCLFYLRALWHPS